MVIEARRRVLEEFDAGGAVKTSYLPHPQVIDEILSFRQGRATHYPLADALGYVIADSSGQITRNYSYDVYGERTSSGDGPQLAFGFTGREHNVDIGLRYHRDRSVDELAGKWIQADRFRMVDGPNLYAYGGSRPTSFVDPTGRWVFGVGVSRVAHFGVGAEVNWFEVIDGSGNFGWLITPGFRLGPTLALSVSLVVLWSTAQSIDRLSGYGVAMTIDTLTASGSMGVTIVDMQTGKAVPVASAGLGIRAGFGVGVVASYAFFIRLTGSDEDEQRLKKTAKKFSCHLADECDSHATTR